jgi:Secretion system C-terminal sorting domain
MMKRKNPFIYTIFGLCAFAGLFLNASGGPKDVAAGAPGDLSCTTSGCHIDNAHDPNGGVTLTGAPASFTAGVSYPLTLTIRDAQAVSGGFQIVATNNSVGNNLMYGTFTGSTALGTKLLTATVLGPLSGTASLNRLVQKVPKPFAVVGGVNSVSWTFDWIAPATGSGVRFYFTGNASNDDGDQTVGDVIYISNKMTVPIELMSFSGELAEKSVKLTWKTASERNNRVFEIERNIVGSTNRFEKIGEVKGLINSSAINTYNFSDDGAQADKISYYRLHQVDLDGTSTFSKVISIGLKATNKGFRLYPNFVNQGSDIQIETGNNEAITFDIIDISGKIIQSIKKAQNTEGVKISTIGLPTGRYFIRSTGLFNLQTATFIVF